MSLTAILRHRRDTAANLTSANPVLEDGQLAYETDTRKAKLGDGVATWTSLPYMNSVPASLDALGDVSAPTPSNGQGLVWNSAQAQWVASTIAAGGGSVTSAAHASLAASVANAVSAINVVSNAVSIVSVAAAAVSADLTSVKNNLESIRSAQSATNVSINNAISVVSNAVSVVSVAAANALSVANAASNAASVVSVAVAAETSNRISADNALSARIDTVSNALSAKKLISLADVSGTPSDGQIPQWNSAAGKFQFSTVVAGTGSVTSDELSAVSAAAASADASLSARIDTASNAVSIVSVAAANALSVANAASNAASVVSVAVAAEISNRTSADNALSVRINTQSQAISILSQQVSVLSARVATNSAQMVSADNAISNAVSIVSVAAANALSVANAASNAASVVSVAVAAEISNRVSADNALSGRIDTVSNALSAKKLISLADVSGTPADGQIPTWNSAAAKFHFSTVVAGAGSVTSTELSAVSAAAASADASLSVRIDTASNAASIVSVAQAATSAELTSVKNNLESIRSAQSAANVSINNAISVVSVAAAGASAAAAAASAAVAAVSAAHASLAASVAGALSAIAANSADVTSVKNNLESIRSAQSAKDVSINNAISVISQQVSVLSARVAANSVQMVSADNAISNAVSIVSVVAANALSVANAASNAASVVSAAVASEISNRTSADNALSGRIDTVSNALSAKRLISLADVSGTPADGQVAMWNSAAAKFHFSTVTGGPGGGSVTSAAHASLAASVAGALSAIAANSAQMTSADNAISAAAANALSVANAASTALSAYKVAPKTWPLMGLGGYQFDGSTDYLDGNALTGIADAKVGTIVIRCRLPAAAAQQEIIHTTGDAFRVIRQADGDIQIIAENSGGTVIMNFASTSTPTSAAGDYIIMASWDLATGSSARLYVNDVAVTMTTATYTDDTIDYTVAEYAIGATVGGANKITGDIYAVWFDPTTYIDFSTESNRRKFTDRNGIMVFLGASGELPTGASPGLFLGYNAYTSWPTNRGTFTGTWTENGTPGAVGTSAQGQFGPLNALITSAEYLSLANRVSGISTQMTSADGALSGRIDSVANAISVISQQVSILSVAVAAASNYASVASNAASVASNAASVALQAASVASNAASVAVAAVAGVPDHQIRIVSNTQSIAVSTMTDISGLILTLSAGETWRIEGMVLISTSVGTVGLNMGCSVAPLSTPRFLRFGRLSAGQSAGYLGGGGMMQVSGSSVFLSAANVGGVLVGIEVMGVFNVASAGIFQLQAKGLASVAASPLHIMPGSFLLCHKIK